ncbi:MAG: aldehyde dehydrogenase family protein, partial [Bacteroidota bacterium]
MINETTIAFGNPELPFGGVNYSGIGKAHGHAGYMAFTNEKPVVRQTTFLPSTMLAHAPYKPWKNKILNLVMRWF